MRKNISPLSWILSPLQGERGHKAFTLVELIVVITILAILATIGFVWYSQYLVWTRDSNRISQLNNISQALTIYSTKKSLPIPEDNVEIKVWAWASEKTIAYQGYAWKNIIEQINYSTEWVDPKDWEYFTYYLTKDRKYFQLMAFLEDSDDLQNKTAWILPKVYAGTYEDRHPTVYWAKLWVLTDEENTPIQEVSTIKTAWELNISSTTDIYIARMKDSIEPVKWSWSTLTQINPKASCKRLYEAENKRNDWVYTIDPEGNWTGFKVYCDMTTDWGGWTLLVKAISWENDFHTSSKLWDIKDMTFKSKNTYKLEDINIKKFNNNSIFRIELLNSNFNILEYKYFQIEDISSFNLWTRSASWSNTEMKWEYSFEELKSLNYSNAINTAWCASAYWPNEWWSACWNEINMWYHSCSPRWFWKFANCGDNWIWNLERNWRLLIK